ncbi:MAG: molybdopterin-dependent oxidoreductase, partial [Alphaproteobacteria bacterium]|nr:molybdopterin-dependent oxidoreductase [Alphaproteobacteria bacterium]
TPGIDVMDALGTNIRIDSRGRAVLRALPRISEEVNEEWASDKTRWAVDGLLHRRLDKPFVRVKGKLQAASWEEAFGAVAKAAKAAGSSVAAIGGDLVDCETLYAARELVKALGGSALEGRQTGLAYDVSSLAAVNFNTGIANLERADVILLVGTNPRHEAAVLNTRIRKAVRKGGAKVFAIGPEIDLTYPVQWLGAELKTLTKLPKDVDEALTNAKRPVLIMGGLPLKFEGAHGAALALAAKYKLVRVLEDGTAWNGYNVLHFTCARSGGLLLGYAHDGGIKGLAATKPKLSFFLGADEVDYSLFADTFKVYLGHHGDAGAHAADVVLPAAAYTEKPGTYVNLEGRVQHSLRAVFPPGDAREDWTILRALSEVLGHTLPFDSYD